MSRKDKYLKQLRAVGFRSWKKANERRHELIKQKYDVWSGCYPQKEAQELEALQKLSSLYLKYRFPPPPFPKIKRHAWNG
jgi:hypothetical protein